MENHNTKKADAKTSKKAKVLLRSFVNFIIGNLIVGICFSLPMVYYGPFNNIKEMLVTTAMTTYRHQYIAKWFLSDSEIYSIMEKNKIDDNKNSNIGDIHIDYAKIKGGQESSTDGIEVKNINIDRFKGYMIIVDNPKRIELGVTDKLNKYGMTLDTLAEKNNSIAGINAGGFQDEEGQGNGGVPTGIVIKDGKLLFDDKKEDEVPLIGFNKDGVLILGKYTRDQIPKLNIKDAVSFSPFVVVNGEPTIKGGDGGWGIHPRTAIGQTKDGKVLLLVIDGRQPTWSIGATMKDVQDIMLEYGAYNAANLDGGSSSTIYMDGKIINKPSSKDGPRFLPTAFLVK